MLDWSRYCPLFVLFAFTACSRDPAPGAAPTRPVASTPAIVTPSAAAPTVAVPTSDCERYVAQFRETLGSASNACTSNADCACYPGGLSCGGVADRVTAVKLGAIVTDFESARCPRKVQCAPWLCNAICAGGRCANR